ncbi:MAG TPA: V-type ATP synthase subunit F [Candidatus Thermoplasmatota archaeon]|nr:V-type ATP synthase subunit F [Candidatus Thermoplasmatota archaeon]
MSKSIAVFGSDDFVLGFRLAGIKRVSSGDLGVLESEVAGALDDRGVGIVVLEAKDADGFSATLKRRIASSVDPVVITLGGEGSGDLREKVKRAIGIDLFKD